MIFIDNTNLTINKHNYYIKKKYQIENKTIENL